MEDKKADLVSSKLDHHNSANTSMFKPRSGSIFYKALLCMFVIASLAIIHNTLKLHWRLHEVEEKLDEQKNIVSQLNISINSTLTFSPRLVKLEELYATWLKNTTSRKNTSHSRKHGRKHTAHSPQSSPQINHDNNKGLHMIFDWARPTHYTIFNSKSTSEEPIRYWKVSDSALKSKPDFAYLVAGGYVRVKEAGLYIVYSQITYYEYDIDDKWSYWVKIGNRNATKCTHSEMGKDEGESSFSFLSRNIHQCYTTVIAYIAAYGEVQLMQHQHRSIQHEEDKTFWGIVKLN